MKRRTWAWGAGAVLFAGLTQSASAEPVDLGSVSMTNIEHNTTLTGSSYSVLVQGDETAANAHDLVRFTFTNDSANQLDGAIGQIYFYDGTILGSTMDIGNSNEVQFSQDFTLGGQNDKLPGYKEPTVAFNADAENGSAGQWRIQSGESLTIVFELLSGVKYDSIMNDLLVGKLDIGIHVQGIDKSQVISSDSDSFMNGPPTLVPLPAPLWGGLVLLGALGAKRLQGRRTASA